jgi:hypothetical protein
MAKIGGSVLTRLHNFKAYFFAERHFASLLIFVCLVLCIHFTTVKHYPLCWLDEVDIIEVGRFSTYNQHPNWSINLMPGESNQQCPPPFFHYLGGGLLETVYRTTGNFVAVRITAMMGLLPATLLLYVWLRKKKFTPLIAWITAMLFMADPNVSVGLHWYRIDLWVFAITFTCFILVASARGQNDRDQYRALCLTGALMILESFFWITSILHWIFILAEILALATTERWSLKKYSWAVMAGLCGAMSMLALCLIPVYQEISQTINVYLTRTEVGGTLNRFSNADGLKTHEWIERSFLFIKLIMRTPFVWFGVILGAFSFRKYPFQAVALLIASIIVISTQVYHNRVNYLTPMVLLFFALGLNSWLYSKIKVFRILSCIFIVSSFVYAYGLSVIGMNYFAQPFTMGNTYDFFEQKLEYVVGKGPKRVYTFTYDPYHVGRELGWQMYSFLPGRPEALFTKSLSANLIEKLDYILVGDDYPLTDDQKQFLLNHKFEIIQRILMPTDHPTGLTKTMRAIIYARGYPSFTVWSKKKEDQ